MDNNRKEKKFFEYSVENRMGQSVGNKKAVNLLWG